MSGPREAESDNDGLMAPLTYPITGVGVLWSTDGDRGP